MGLPQYIGQTRVAGCRVMAFDHIAAVRDQTFGQKAQVMVFGS